MLKNISLCGVGGQGVLLVSRLIADAALRSGYDVRRSEVHGMSQRGGSVISQVRYGARIYSPLIPSGASHVLVALELLEAARTVHELREDGVLLVNDLRIQPSTAGLAGVEYPADVVALCENATESCLILPASRIALDLDETRAANTVMLGAFSVFAPEIETSAWDACISNAFRPEHVAVNLKAFRAGRERAVAAFPAPTHSS